VDIPATIYEDDDTEIEAIISNIGEQDISDSFICSLLINGTTKDTVTIDSLESGDSVDIELEWTPLETGSHTLAVHADSGNSIEEANKSNNSYSTTVEVESQPGGPDLTISDMDVDSPVYTDAETAVTITIENSGDTDIDDSFRVRLYADTRRIDTVTVDELDAGEELDIDFEWEPEQAGRYTLKVKVDLSDDVEEYNESNNEDTLQVTVVDPDQDVDIVVTAIDMLNDAQANVSVGIIATVINTGEHDIADSFSIALVVDGKVVQSLNLPGLHAGNNQNIEFHWTPNAAKEYVINVIADSEGTIEEINESNNSGSLVVVAAEFPKPDLEVSGITTASPLTAGEPTMVASVVTNTGELDCMSTSITNLLVDGDLADTMATESLAVGQSTIVMFTWTPPFGGDYSLTIVADATNTIDESSEDNNEKEQGITVVGEEGGKSAHTNHEAEQATLSACLEVGEVHFSNTNGDTLSLEYEINIINSGNEDILVTAEVLETVPDAVKQSLKIDGWPWDLYELSVPEQRSRTIHITLAVPSSFQYQITSENILTFWIMADNDGG
jgi:subtilase family serine protease